MALLRTTPFFRTTGPRCRRVTFGTRPTRRARTRYGYEQLLIATGARPRRLNVPGTELDGVFALRSLADSASIGDAARGGNRARRRRGGFIGMEVAASLRRLGLQVALIHLGSGLFDQLGSRDLSDQLASLYSERGVEVLLEQEVAAFGGDGRLAYVETKSGDRVEVARELVGGRS